ncbi:MAG: signal recognition particle protein Srp19 [Fervidicoccus sp.]|nr:MAG: signal recognition particle protein Srp19 [Fervidicoccus sp.]
MESSRKFSGKKVVIYPSYLDSHLSRRMGRKVPLQLSIPKPSAREITLIAERLGLNPIVEQKKYPKRWWEDKERVVVGKIGSKRKTLLMIAAELKKSREQKASSEQ